MGSFHNTLNIHKFIMTDEEDCVMGTTVSGEPVLAHPISRTCLQRYSTIPSHCITAQYLLVTESTILCIPLYISDVTKTCNATVLNRASNSNIRYGHCIPFRKQEQESLCDNFYTSGVDYIYVPNTRNNGRYSRLMKDIINFAPILLARLDKCYEPALRIICHFYLPPCGNSTSFELPTSVCEETCMRVQESCGQEWESVLEMFRQNRIALEIEGTAFIDCENTGKHLSPLPHNCIAMEHLCEFF